MGTLTADIPRLDAHCPHKLPTSCRLTSIPKCCACADRRPHSATYRVYVDGIGFVPRGTRWQSYCWFCKVFWDNRIAVAHPPLRPSDTRIPEVPDLTEFLDKWFEFHQGYRTVSLENGAESRIAVVGEPFKEVSPGQLPRTLDEMRVGLMNSLIGDDRRRNGRRLQPAETHNSAGQGGDQSISLEDTLDQLLQEAESEDASSRPSQEQHALTELPTEVKRRLSHLLNAVNSLHNRIRRLVPAPHDPSREARLLGLSAETAAAVVAEISDLQWQATSLPQPRSTRHRHQPGEGDTPLEHLVESIHTHLEEAKQRVQSASRHIVTFTETYELTRVDLSESQAQVEALKEKLAHTQRQFRTAESFARVFGTREEIQGEEYESPLGSMFTRAFSRYRQAEEERQTQGPIAGSIAGERDQPSTSRAHDTYARFREASLIPPDAPPGDEELAMQLSNTRSAASVRPLGLDADNRPKPKTDEELTVRLECRVCYTQQSSVILLPCSHVTMCQWCCDQQVPASPHDSTIALRGSTCPLCRRKVKRRVPIFFS